MEVVGTRTKDNTLAMGDPSFAFEGIIKSWGWEGVEAIILECFSKATKDVGRKHLFLEKFVAGVAQGGERYML